MNLDARNVITIFWALSWMAGIVLVALALVGGPFPWQPLFIWCVLWRSATEMYGRMIENT